MKLIVHAGASCSTMPASEYQRNTWLPVGNYGLSEVIIS